MSKFICTNHAVKAIRIAASLTTLVIGQEEMSLVFRDKFLFPDELRILWTGLAWCLLLFCMKVRGRNGFGLGQTAHTIRIFCISNQKEHPISSQRHISVWFPAHEIGNR